jgi:hypothetical protein
MPNVQAKTKQPTSTTDICQIRTSLQAFAEGAHERTLIQLTAQMFHVHAYLGAPKLVK